MIPYWFHPTRVIIVDDTHALNDLLQKPQQASHMTFKHINTIQESLHYINEVYRLEPFHVRYGACGISNKFDIHHEIYRPQRFEEISSLIVKYTPPQFPYKASIFESLSKIQNPYIQKLLLIEKEYEALAIKAHKDGLIQGYICTRTMHPVKIWEILEEAQWCYFTALSEEFVNTMKSTKHLHQAVSDPLFHKFFKTILSSHGFTEAYLCEKTGSYLFLDEQAQDHGLVVHIADQFDRWIKAGQAKGVNLPL